MKDMKNNMILAIVVVAVVAAGAGFFGGMKYQQRKLITGFGRLANGQGNGTMMFGRNGQQAGGQQGGQGSRIGTQGFRPVSGSILSTGDNSITVKLADGSTKIVLLSDSTQLNKADQASKQDLKVGATVAVFGQTNADGSVSAQNIQLNPQTMMLQSGTNGTPSASPKAQ